MEKVFHFPPKSIWDVFTKLKEEEILNLIELEKIREERGGKSFIDEVKKDKYNFIFSYKIIDTDKKQPWQFQFWQKMNRLGAFLRQRPEYVTEEIAAKMKETKLFRNYSDIVVFKESASGVKVPVVPHSGYHSVAKKIPLERMEKIYYSNLNTLLRIQSKMIKEIEKRLAKKKSKESELIRMRLKDLVGITWRISSILETFKKKKSDELIIKFDIANMNREDYWRKYNEYITRNVKSS
jgi:hypothetical protein